MSLPTMRLPRFTRNTIAGLSAAALVGTGIALTTTHSADANDADGVSTTTPIKHLVVIYDENESFDHYFGTYPRAANTDGVKFTAKAGTPTPKNLISDNAITNNPNSTKPFRLKSTQASTCDQKHSYTPEQQAMNWSGGKALMNLFRQKTSSDTCSGLYGRAGLTMGYFDGNTVTGLWNYAQNYAMSDNHWAATFGPSTPGAIEVVSGQTWGALAYDSTSPTDNPALAASQSASGLAQVDPVTGLGTLIGDPDPVYDDCSNNNHKSSSNVVGMQNSNQNIGDLLNAKGVTWGWFQGGFKPTKAWTHGSYAQCSSAHTNLAGQSERDYSPHHNPFAYYESTSNPHHLRPTSVANIGHTDQANHNYDLSDFTAALNSGNLPAVSYVKASEYQDAHPGYSDPIGEQHFLVNTINAIQKSPQWKSTAIIVTYDDSDGWYDHVAPTITNASNSSDDAAICTEAATTLGVPIIDNRADRCGPSQRLPFLVISPYSKRNHVDHTLISQPSVVGFIENNWTLGSIGGGSFDASAGSILSLFDFAHPQPKPVLLNQNGTIVKPSVSLHTRAAKAKHGKVKITVKVTVNGSSTKPGGTITGRVNGRKFKAAPVRKGVAHVTVKVRKHKRNTVVLTFTSPGYNTAKKTIKVKG